MLGADCRGTDCGGADCGRADGGLVETRVLDSPSIQLIIPYENTKN